MILRLCTCLKSLLKSIFVVKRLKNLSFEKLLIEKLVQPEKAYYLFTKRHGTFKIYLVYLYYKILVDR